MIGRGPCRDGPGCNRPGCWFDHSGSGINVMSTPGVAHGGKGASPCRFGLQCNRSDCWYNHPPGRVIAASGNDQKGGKAGKPPCRFGKTCTRSDCWYPHPDGRQSSGPAVDPIEEDLAQLAAEEERKDMWISDKRDCKCCKGFVYRCEAEICKNLGECVCSYDHQDEQSKEDEEDAEIQHSFNAIQVAEDDFHADTWIPWNRNCDCCKGFIYACKGTECVKLKQCKCSKKTSESK